jgi:hypothetical protein
MIGARKGLDDRIRSRFEVSGYVEALASAAPGENQIYKLPVAALAVCEVTGICYQVGSTSNGNVAVAIYGETGEERLAKSAATAQATAKNFQRVPFSSVLTVTPGQYWLAIIFSSATGTAMCSANMNPWATNTESKAEPPAKITVPSALVQTTKCPFLMTY